jgi:hypothetical protein
MGDDLWGKAMVFVAFRLGVGGHVGGPSGSTAAYTRVGDRLIMPPAGRARNKLSMPIGVIGHERELLAID